MSKPRILVVDDNWPVGKLVGSRLEQTGCFDVRVEHMPSAAPRAATEFLPQLFLLDVDMPGQNGLELAAQLCKDPAFARTPVIFLTSLVTADEAGARELISQGRRYVSKSASVDILRQCIERALTSVHSGS